ncbi:hypothetical protein HC723_06350 [Vibrio sp. S11_S32]|uniref:hypothetical protein n=1 Tax=Vibrio sp. S11_S32 TaxID=2720225 RepID=UPI001680061C|nr:hypothetical protein [Vibrio sp. S11_S32]MBD1576068.1 hypothetical protein [Vibrio sp. S11_S32]
MKRTMMKPIFIKSIAKKALITLSLAISLPVFAASYTIGTALLRNSNLEVTTLEWYYFNQFGKF